VNPVHASDPDPPDRSRASPSTAGMVPTRNTALDYWLAAVMTLLPFLGTMITLILACLGKGPGPLDLILFGTFYLAALVGVELGYHRYFAHHSFETSRTGRAVLAILGSIAFEGPVIWWVATHRRHHQYSDRSGDPHSPNLHGAGPRGLIRGLVHAHVGWLFDPHSTRFPGWNRYANDLYRDELILTIHLQYFLWLGLGLALPSLLGGVLSWSWRGMLMGFLWGGLVRVFVMNQLFWCINSLGHRFGGREHMTHDRSTNIVWLVLPTLGQSLHNNHHAHPSSAFMSERWYQLDPGGWILRLLQKAGLVWDLKTSIRLPKDPLPTTSP